MTESDTSLADFFSHWGLVVQVQRVTDRFSGKNRVKKTVIAQSFIVLKIFRVLGSLLSPPKKLSCAF
jgi:hypothetical protein